MFTGEYRPAMDSKGRLNFPAKLREELGSSFYVTKWLDNCLAVYSLEDWTRIEEKIRTLPASRARQIQRFLFAGAALLEPDKQGRVLIPQNLRDYAGLSSGDITVTGVANHVEIWNCERWTQMNEELTSEAVADALGELVL